MLDEDESCREKKKKQEEGREWVVQFQIQWTRKALVRR